MADTAHIIIPDIFGWPGRRYGEQALFPSALCDWPSGDKYRKMPSKGCAKMSIMSESYDSLARDYYYLRTQLSGLSCVTSLGAGEAQVCVRLALS